MTGCQVDQTELKVRIAMDEICVTFDIDFHLGEIDGDFEVGMVTRLEMATMLEAVAQKLRDTPEPVAFVSYDDGSVRIG